MKKRWQYTCTATSCSLDKKLLLVRCCFLLHNLMIDSEDEEYPDADPEENEDHVGVATEPTPEEIRAGVERRLEYAEILWARRAHAV